MSLPQEIDFNYNVRSLNFQIAFPNKIKVEAENYFLINIAVTSESSLIHWKFSTADYDIAFGIYRFHTVADIHPKELPKAIQNGKVESIMKILR